MVRTMVPSGGAVKGGTAEMSKGHELSVSGTIPLT